MHGPKVLTVDKTGKYEGDGLITAQSNLALAVRTADCVPILLAQEGKGRFDTPRSLSVPPKAGRIETNGTLSDRSTTAFKTHILPIIEREVSYGKHFAQFRQIYRAMILAAWFKNKLKNTILDASYLNKGKIKGADTADHRDMRPTEL